MVSTAPMCCSVLVPYTAPKVKVGAITVMNISNDTAIVFWFKLVNSETQWVPTVVLRSDMIPFPQGLAGSARYRRRKAGFENSQGDVRAVPLAHQLPNAFARVNQHTEYNFSSVGDKISVRNVIVDHVDHGTNVGVVVPFLGIFRSHGVAVV
jgi:hypothetical protein